MADIFNQVAAPLERMSLLVQLRDKVAIATSATHRTCGGCQHWMKSRACPKEKNVNGHTRGPSCNATPCDKFLADEKMTEIGREKCREAMAFAVEHGLPVPSYLVQSDG